MPPDLAATYATKRLDEMLREQAAGDTLNDLIDTE